MAWTSPRTWVPDEVVTADVMNVHVRDNLKAIGDAWTSYTPTLAQGVSTNISKTVNYAKYIAVGKLVICQINLTASAAGTAGSDITSTLPVTAATSGVLVGSGMYNDASVGEYRGTAYLPSTTTVSIVTGSNTTTGAVGVNPNFAVASTDTFRVFVVYEAA